MSLRWRSVRRAWWRYRWWIAAWRSSIYRSSHASVTSLCRLSSDKCSSVNMSAYTPPSAPWSIGNVQLPYNWSMLFDNRMQRRSTGLSSRVVSASDGGVRGSRFESRRWQLRYDTIRDAILTCARKPTWVGLIYCTETTTENCKTEKLKSNNSLC